MGWTIAKRFSFDAAHRLEGLTPGHKCGRFHGHTYTCEFIMQSHRLDQTGMVRDYGDLTDVKVWVDTWLDHQSLNALIPGATRNDAPPLGDHQVGNPTAERLARWMFNRWCNRYPELVAVRVSETPGTWAEYRSDLRELGAIQLDSPSQQEVTA